MGRRLVLGLVLLLMLVGYLAPLVALAWLGYYWTTGNM